MVDLDKTIVWNPNTKQGNMLATGTGSGAYLHQTFQRLKLIDTSTVQGDREVTGGNVAATGRWEVIQFGTEENFQPSWRPAKFGSGLAFDGVDDRLETGYTDTNSQITISAWIYPNSENSLTRIAEKRTDGDEVQVFYLASLSAFNLRFIQQFSSGQGQWHTANGTITPNAWNHVAVTYDNSSASNDPIIYINGISQPLTESATPSGTALTNTDPYVIGNRGAGDRAFNGTIDDFKIYNYIRTQGQITEDMNGGHPAPGSPVGSALIHWKFDETHTGANVVNNSGSDPSLVGAAGGSVLFTSQGKFGRAVSFTAATGRITARDVAFTDSLGAMTISVWVNPQSLATNRAIISKSNHVNNNSFLIRTNSSNSDEIDFFLASNSSDTSNYFTTSNLDLTTGVWQLLTFVYDGTASAADRITIYKNGMRVLGTITGTIPASMVANTGMDLRLGGSTIANPPDDALISYMDDLKIFTSALTADQVKMLVNQSTAVSFGTLSTAASGAADNSLARSYCVPGDTAPCPLPVAHYPFDENDDQRTQNYTEGGGSQLTLGANATPGSDDPQWVPGKIGAALRFDGTDDLVQGANDAALNIGTDDFTIEAWVNRGATGANHTFVSKGGRIAQTGVGYVAWIDSSTNVIRLQLNDGTRTYTLNGTTAITTPGWHHVVMVIDRDNEANTTIYLNGKQDKAGATCSPSCTNITNMTDMTSTSNFKVGHQAAGANFFNGMIDNVIIYNYARTPAQVAWSHNRGGPVAWWRMDECQGNTIHDATGNGLHGTLNLGGSGQTSAGDCVTNANTAWYNGRNGKFNASLNFDGTNDYVEVPDPGTGSALDFDTGSAISISAWVYPLTLTSEGNYRTILTKGWTSSDNGNYLLEIGRRSGNDVIAFCYKRLSSTASCYYTNTDVVETNAWQHITVTYTFGTGSSMRIYKDGQLLSGSWESGDGDTGPTLNNDALWIGGDSFTWIDGQIDDVRIYRYPLTTHQIRDIVNHGAVRFGE